MGGLDDCTSALAIRILGAATPSSLERDLRGALGDVATVVAGYELDPSYCR